MADTFDLKLRSGNELDLSGGQLQLVGGAAWVRQAIQTSISLVLGEWFIDPTVGMPYFDQVLVKNPNLSLVRSVFKKAILAVPHVTGLPTLDLNFDRAARELSLSFVATTDLGLVSGSWPATGDAPAVPTISGIAGTVISGSADPGSTVTVLVDGEVSGFVHIGAPGAWRLDVAGLAPGSAVTARSGTSAESAPFYVPVPPPTITSPADGFTYVVVPPPGYTDSWTEIEVTGRALPNADVEAELLDADGVRVGAWSGGTADADGNFSFILLGTVGANTIQAHQAVNGSDYSPFAAPVHVTGVVALKIGGNRMTVFSPGIGYFGASFAAPYRSCELTGGDLGSLGLFTGTAKVLVDGVELPRHPSLEVSGFYGGEVNTAAVVSDWSSQWEVFMAFPWSQAFPEEIEVVGDAGTIAMRNIPTIDSAYYSGGNIHLVGRHLLAGGGAVTDMSIAAYGSPSSVVPPENIVSRTDTEMVVTPSISINASVHYALLVRFAATNLSFMSSPSGVWKADGHFIMLD